MDVSFPFRSLVPTLESSVLDVLARTEDGLNASQIARLSRRGTRAGQTPVLDRLVTQGLVIADRANTGHLYRLNREHVLAPAVLIGVEARHEALSRLASAVGELEPTPTHASVFGSFAREDGDDTSDIDLLLVLPDDVDMHTDAWQDQVAALAEQVELWTGNRLETLALTESRLADAAKRGERIVDESRQDAVPLFGAQLSALTGTLSG